MKAPFPDACDFSRDTMLVKASSASLSKIGKWVNMAAELSASDGAGDAAAQLRYTV